MKKKYKVIVTSETVIEVDITDNISDEELLNKIENEMDKGYVSDNIYFEIDSEVTDNNFLDVLYCTYF